MFMNKRLLTATIVLELVILVTLNYDALGVQAQIMPDQPMPEPYQTYWETYKPKTTPMTIIITSPQNYNITNETSISLAFNVSAPRTVTIPEPARAVRTQLTSVCHQGDWQTEKQELYAYDFVHASSEDKHFDFLEFNTTLSGIPEGTHEVQIVALSIINTNAAMFGFTYNYGFLNASINFTVNSLMPTQTNQNSAIDNEYSSVLLTIIPIAVSVAVLAVVASLLLYGRHRKHVSLSK